MFYLVRNPLTHMKKIEPELINGYSNQLKQEMKVDNLSYPEISIIQDANLKLAKIETGEEITPEETENNNEETVIEGGESNEIVQNESIDSTNEVVQNQAENEVANNIETSENVENNTENTEQTDVRTPENIKKMTINMEFLGLDLSSVPNTQWTNYKVYIIPVLYVLSTFITMRLTSKMTQTGKEEDKSNDMEMLNQMNKNMSLMMPILSISISWISPLGLALYWLVNNILNIVERLAIQEFLKREEEKNV